MMQQLGPQCYGYPAQAAPSANAVNIQIFNPQAYATPQQQQQPQQVQNPIYNYPQQSLYGMPYQNAYQQPMVQQQTYMPQTQQQAFIPQMSYPAGQTVDQYGQMQQTTGPVMQTPVQQPQPAQPQQMPAPVLMQPAIQQPVQQPIQQPVQQPAQPQAQVEPQAQQVQPQQQPVQEQATAQQPAQAQAQVQQQPVQEQPKVEVVQPQQPSQAVDVNKLLAGLKSNDNNVQYDTITEIANMSQGTPDKQSAVLNESIMTALAEIASKDISGLQGPTQAQMTAKNKAASGMQLTPEEAKLATEWDPKTAAGVNKVISLFTLAMLQKNQREEIDRYNQSQTPQNQLPQLKANDLIGYNAIENAARNGSDKEVQLAAIQALSYIARPEDKEAMEPVLNAAIQSTQEPLIQQAASEVLTNIGAAPKKAEVITDVNFKPMSKKEKKAMEKEQKALAKQAAKEAKKAAKEAKKAAKNEKAKAA